MFSDNNAVGSITWSNRISINNAQRQSWRVSVVIDVIQHGDAAVEWCRHGFGHMQNIWPASERQVHPWFMHIFLYQEVCRTPSLHLVLLSSHSKQLWSSTTSRLKRYNALCRPSSYKLQVTPAADSSPHSSCRLCSPRRRCRAFYLRPNRAFL